MPCLEIYRTGQMISTFEILKKILFTSLKKRALGVETESSRSVVECSTTELYPASANLCFAFRRKEYENALSRNIQNGTDDFRFRNSQKKILFTSLKKRGLGVETESSRSVVECSTTELYPRVSEPLLCIP
ncbi:hypothetical protein TNCV_2521261 [Trichonephila clavipes]|nr:hypothetical protein TNCV_2521261 [Trichonephila clavipes]